MRWARRKDRNHPEIVAALRGVGATVEPLDGKRIPDLLVGYRGQNWLLEVKDPGSAHSKRKPTKKSGATAKRQAEFRATWRGQQAVVTSIEEALAVIGAKAVVA